MSDEPCPLCGGTGWVLEPSGGGTKARRCSCLDERRRHALLERARIPRRYRSCTLDNFELHHDSHRKALETARRFVEKYPEQDAGLLFIGPCGVGKTHLAVAVIVELMKTREADCVFYDFRDLIRDIQSAHAPDSPLTETDILQPVFQCDVLVLDELGARRTSSWVEETVFYVINNRYNNRKLTVFTSNFLDTEEEGDLRNPYFKKEEDTLVDRIGVRLRSRIYEMCVLVPMEGKDYRRVVRQDAHRERLSKKKQG
ncbi:MAG: ATP-binding protein [Candidatus Aminicenantes bacterium]|nr:ATP-binding protein [Candidatus Aminicenantes bacterium]